MLERKLAACGCPLEEGHVVAGLWQVPEAGEFSDVQKYRSTYGCKHTEVESSARGRARDKRITRGQRKRPVGSHQTIQTSLHNVTVREHRREDCQTQLDNAGVAAEFRLHKLWIDQLATAQPPKDDNAA